MTTPGTPLPLDARITGLLALAMILLTILSLWQGPAWAGPVAGLVLVPMLALMAIRANPWRLIFLAVGVVLMIAAAATHPDWQAEILAALERGAFIGTYFAALATLRHAADTSPTIRTCGYYLAHQPPGRRYIALTAGGQAFALLLNYGAIPLLSSLAIAGSRDEPDLEVRKVRQRRMLLAIQRGFGSMLPWSPLAFAVALTSALVPGVSWGRALPYALVSSVLLVAIGWALDTLFKPRLSHPAQPRKPGEAGSWTAVLPLLGLLVGLMSLTMVLHEVTGLKVTAIVLLVVPVIAIGWFAIQAPPGGRIEGATARTRRYVLFDLPGYRDEMILLPMAGVIGSLGGTLLAPAIAASGVDLSAIPGWLILLALVWLTPLGGQIGMNPILAVTLMIPLIPPAAAIGLHPNAIFIAITAGWALSASSSPYTATTLMLGSYAGVSARRVGLVWNGAYTLISGLALSGWVVAMWAFGLG